MKFLVDECLSQMFRAALRHIQHQRITDLINQVLELDFDDETGILCARHYQAPAAPIA